MKIRKPLKTSLSLAAAMGTLALATSSQAAVVSTINDDGAVTIFSDLGTFTSGAMQTLITTTADLDFAGVLDAEGVPTGNGDFSQDTGVLSDKISGAVRYGVVGGAAQYASGVQFGFVSATETWTPDAGLTHFGLITSAGSANDILTVTVTYSDTTIAGATGVAGQTNWMGFHKAGQTITSIALSDSNPAQYNWANYDDVSLVFAVPEPSSAALLLGLGSIALVLRRRK
jgi:hypothetical protein